MFINVRSAVSIISDIAIRVLSWGGIMTNSELGKLEEVGNAIINVARTMTEIGQTLERISNVIKILDERITHLEKMIGIRK